MAYAAQSDLLFRLTQKVLNELSDFDNDGVADDAVVAAALADATAKIDSYAGGRYTVPLAASDQVKNLCLDLTIWRLYTNRNRPLPQPLLDAYTAGMKFLMDVAKGLASLDGQSAGTTQVSSSDVVTRDHDEDPEVFDANKLTGF